MSIHIDSARERGTRNQVKNKQGFIRGEIRVVYILKFFCLSLFFLSPVGKPSISDQAIVQHERSQWLVIGSFSNIVYSHCAVLDTYNNWTQLSLCLQTQVLYLKELCIKKWTLWVSFKFKFFLCVHTNTHRTMLNYRCRKQENSSMEIQESKKKKRKTLFPPCKMDGQSCDL